jgi:hypothetical protein
MLLMTTSHKLNIIWHLYHIRKTWFVHLWGFQIIGNDQIEKEN